MTVKSQFSIELANYYSITRVFRNMLKQADQAWSSAYYPTSPISADGWIRGMASGGAAQTKVIYTSVVASATQWSKLPTGVYALVWYDSNMTAAIVSATGVQVSGTYNTVTLGKIAGQNRFLFAVTADPPTGNIQLQLTNTSGVAADFAPDVNGNEPYICRTDLETAFLAGEIFDPDFIATLTGAGAIRAMDNLGGKNGVVANFSDYPTEADCTYFQRGSGSTSTLWPPSILAKLCKEVGAACWLNLPWNMTTACAASIASAIAATGFTGTTMVEIANEVWNSSSGVQAAFATLFTSMGLTAYNADGTTAATPTTQQKAQAALAQISVNLWNAMAGTSGFNLARTLCSQLGAFNGSGAFAMQYIDTVSGKRLGAIMGATDYYGVAIYAELSPLGSSTPYTLKQLAEQRFDTKDAAQWIAAYQSYITNYIGYGAGSDFAKLSLLTSANMTSYEGHGDAGYQIEFSVNLYPFTINTTDNTLQSAVDVSAAFANQDELAQRTATGDATTTFQSGTPIGTGFWVNFKSGSTTELYAYATLAAAQADTGRTGVGALTLNGTDANPYAMDNVTRISALITARQNALYGVMGGPLSDAMNAVCQGNYAHRAQYVSSGLQFNYGQWGSKMSQWDTDTMYLKKLKKLAMSTSTTCGGGPGTC